MADDAAQKVDTTEEESKKIMKPKTVRISVVDNFIIEPDHFGESCNGNYSTIQSTSDFYEIDADSIERLTHKSSNISQISNITDTTSTKNNSTHSSNIGNSDSFTFKDGSFLTKSMIEPELETYFKTGSSWQGGILIMANVCLGMGILNFPRVVYEAGGLPFTLIALFVYVILVIGSLYITAYCCRYYACVNYQDMVRVHCGRIVGNICSVLLFMELTGSLIVKMVVIQDQLDRFYSIIFSETSIDIPDKHWYLMPIFAVIFFLPMCFIRDFSCFKYVSVGGVLAAVYVAIAVAVVGYYREGQADPIYFKESSNQPRDFNLLFPLLVYGFHGHIEAPLVFAGLKKQRLRHFMNTVYCYIGITTFCYLITAIFGYLTFGRLTNADFLLNYRVDNWYANIASFIVCFKLFTSFPVLFFVDRSVFSGFYTIIIRALPKSKIRMNLEHYSTARLIQTLLIFILIVIMAAVIPNISNAISIIGAISCHFSFTFPGLCFVSLYYRSTTANMKHFIRKVGGIIFVILGMFFFGTNLTIAIQTLMRGGTVV